jgi:hypothetical protein
MMGTAHSITLKNKTIKEGQGLISDDKLYGTITHKKTNFLRIADRTFGRLG